MTLTHLHGMLLFALIVSAATEEVQELCVAAHDCAN